MWSYEIVTENRLRSSLSHRHDDPWHPPPPSPTYLLVTGGREKKHMDNLRIFGVQIGRLPCVDGPLY